MTWDGSSGDLRAGYNLVRDTLVDNESLPELLLAESEAAQAGSDHRLRGALLTILALVERLEAADLPELVAHPMSHPGRLCQLQALLDAGADRGAILSAFAARVQQLYQQKPARFAGPLSAERILQRRRGEYPEAPKTPSRPRWPLSFGKAEARVL